MNEDEVHEPVSELETVLAPKLDPRWALSGRQFVVVALVTALFVLLNYIPLAGHEVWGDVALGGWILDHHELPAADPFLILAEGMPFTAPNWLVQTSLALVMRRAGAEFISLFISITVLATGLLLWRITYRRTASTWQSLLITTAVLVLNHSQFLSLRVESLGLCAFTSLWWLLETHRQCPPPAKSWKFWAAVPLLLAIWANADLSFVCGLALLLSVAVGAALTWLLSRPAPAANDSISPSRACGLFQLGWLAVTLNPYGMQLIWVAIRTLRNPNVHDLVSRHPFSFGSGASYEVVLAWALGLAALRRSQRPLAWGEILALTGFGLLTLKSMYWVGYFFVTWGIVLAPQLGELLAACQSLYRASNKLVAESAAPTSSTPSFRFSYLALLLVWCGFAFTPAGHRLLGGQPRSAVQEFGKEAPLNVLKYLREHPPQGQVFQPHDWGDWMAGQGLTTDCQLFATGRVEHLPRRVWEDYLLISRGQSGWQNALGRYTADTAIVSLARMPELNRVLRREAGWKLVYEDEIGAIFTRRLNTTPKASAKSAPAGPATPTAGAS